MPEDLFLQNPVKGKNVTLRKTGSSYTIRVPRFWVENQGLKIGEDLETYLVTGGSFILKPIPRTIASSEAQK